MTVLSVDLIGGGRSGSRDSKGLNVWNAMYRVQTDDPFDGPEVVANASALPALYSRYTIPTLNDSDPNALLTSRKPREEGDSRKSWVVTCEYRNDAIEDLEDPDNPLLDADKFSFGFEQFQTIARQSLFDGKRLLNSVDEVFTPPPEVDQSRPVFRVVRNEAIINTAFWSDMLDSVNIATWKGLAPRTVKFQSITSGEIQRRNDIDFYTVNYEFHVNPETWDLRILNQARRFWDPILPASGTLKLTAGEEPITIFVKNNAIVGKGTTVSTDASFYDDKDSAGATVVYMRYRYYKERDFNPFQF